MTSDGAALEEAVTRAAVVGRLLVGVDFDGTLSPIVEDPARAQALPGAIESLAALADLNDTVVAVVSGRSLEDLSTRVAATDRLRLLGSHGSQWSQGDPAVLDDAQTLALQVLRAEVGLIVEGVPGVLTEPKPAGVAVHVRQASRDDAARVLRLVTTGPGSLGGVAVLHGKEVVELSVVDIDKGVAIDLLRAETASDAVVYLGDDVTDERVFARLGADDVGVKVGEGSTAASYRVEDPTAVLALLRVLYRLRRSVVDERSAR